MLGRSRAQLPPITLNTATLFNLLRNTTRVAEQILEKFKPRAVPKMAYYEGLTAEELTQRLGLGNLNAVNSRGVQGGGKRPVERDD